MVTGYLVLGLPILLLGLTRWALIPLAVLAEFRWPSPPVFGPDTPVSVVVPAYNEEVVLGPCLQSILGCGYEMLEVIVVNDGSTDHTLQVMRGFAADPRVVLVDKPNGGKGSALNAGIAHARGDVLIFVDADGLFTPDTIPELLRGFRHDEVGAVCGNDTPVNLDRPLTHLLALMTHVGTGLARRTMALVGLLPIVAGNSGAFRSEVIRQIGGFRTDTVGEDLELTWRVQFAGWDVEFAPHATVLAEVPSTLRGLWRQRVRWCRGLIQTARIHRHRLLAPGRSLFCWYLPLNVASGLVVPVLQLVTLVLLPVVFVASPQWSSLWGLIAFLGFGTGLAACLAGILLDRAWRNLLLLYVLPMWLPYSLFLNAVVLRALWLEGTGAGAAWNKLERTGVRTIRVSPAAVRA